MARPSRLLAAYRRTIKQGPPVPRPPQVTEDPERRVVGVIQDKAE